MPISAVNLRWLTEPHDLHRMVASEEKSLVVSSEGEDFTYTSHRYSVNITIKFQILSNPQSSLTATRQMGLGGDRPHPGNAGTAGAPHEGAGSGRPASRASFPMDLLNPTIRWDWTEPLGGSLGLLGELGSRGRNHRLRSRLAVLVILPQTSFDCGLACLRHRLTRT
jgi:hypothetical protein